MTIVSLRRLSLSALLAATACSTPPAVPRVEGSHPFAVGYHGEVVALGAAEQFPDPAVAVNSSSSARLVTVRTSIVEMTVATAEQFMPGLLARNGAEFSPAQLASLPPMPAPKTISTGRLQPRKVDPPAPSFGQLPVSPEKKVANPLATIRGVHVDPKMAMESLHTLLTNGQAELLGEPEISCIEDSEASISCLDQTALVQRVDLVPSGNAQFASDLSVETVQHGTWLQLSPHRTSAGQLQLGIRLQLRELIQPVPVAETRFGRIHVPAVAVQDLLALETIESGDCLVLGTMSGGTKGRVVLAIVDVHSHAPGEGLADPVTKQAR